MVFLYGGSRVIDGVMTLGTFTAFMAYQIRLIGPVQGLMGLYTGLGAARVSLKRVHEILDEPVEVQDPAAPVPLGRVRGEIVFEDVSCGHGRGADVLDGFALTVSPGEVVALAGRSGSGKSTVADLLVRHLDPDRGRVLLDGTDLRDIALADLRARVAVVAQDTFVFNTSILENVRYARPDAGTAAVSRAVERAGLSDFVASLPDGLDMVVGEEGQALLGGGAAARGDRAGAAGRSGGARAGRGDERAGPGRAGHGGARLRRGDEGADDGADLAPGGDAAVGGPGGGVGGGEGGVLQTKRLNGGSDRSPITASRSPSESCPYHPGVNRPGPVLRLKSTGVPNGALDLYAAISHRGGKEFPARSKQTERCPSNRETSCPTVGFKSDRAHRGGLRGCSG